MKIRVALRTAGHAAWLAAFWVLVLAAPALSQWQGPQVYTENGYHPQVACDRKGNSLVVWTAVGTPDRIYANYLTKDADLGIAPLSSSAINVDYAYDPSAAFDKKGNAIVTFKQAENGVYERLYASFRPKKGYDGPLGFEPRQAISQPDRDVFDSRLAFDKKGNVIVVLTTNDLNSDADRLELWAQRADHSVIFIGVIASSGVDLQVTPQVAIDGKGNVLAVYVREGRVESWFWPGGPGGSQDYATPIVLSDVGASDPQIAFDKKGSAIVVWKRNGSLEFKRRDGGFSPYARTIAGSDDAYGHRVAIDKKRNVRVVWEERSSNRIKTAFLWVEHDSSTFSAADYLSAEGEVAQSPALAFDGKSNFLVVWLHSGVGIKASFFPYPSGWTTPVLLPSNGPDYWSAPAIAFDGKRNARVVWGVNGGVEGAYHPKR